MCRIYNRSVYLITILCNYNYIAQKEHQWLANQRDTFCTLGRMKSARPPSARPAAPRLKEKTEILAEEEINAR